MELDKAVTALPWMNIDRATVSIPKEQFDALLAAAKETLARQECKHDGAICYSDPLTCGKCGAELPSKPKRYWTLEREEEYLRKVSKDYGVHVPGGPRDEVLLGIADRLKALRETVVPWLRSPGWYELGNPMIYREPVVGKSTIAIEDRTARDMLRALGETP